MVNSSTGVGVTAMLSPGSISAIRRRKRQRQEPTQWGFPQNDHLERLARAARYIAAGSSKQCVTLEVTVHLPGGLLLSVPCFEGITTVKDILAVSRYRSPYVQGKDVLYLCSRDGERLDENIFASEVFCDKTELKAELVSDDIQLDPALDSIIDEENICVASIDSMRLESASPENDGDNMPTVSDEPGTLGDVDLEAAARSDEEPPLSSISSPMQQRRSMFAQREAKSGTHLDSNYNGFSSASSISSHESQGTDHQGVPGHGRTDYDIVAVQAGSHSPLKSATGVRIKTSSAKFLCTGSGFASTQDAPSASSSRPQSAIPSPARKAKRTMHANSASKRFLRPRSAQPPKAKPGGKTQQREKSDASKLAMHGRKFGKSPSRKAANIPHVDIWAEDCQAKGSAPEKVRPRSNTRPKSRRSDVARDTASSRRWKINPNPFDHDSSELKLLSGLRGNGFKPREKTIARLATQVKTSSLHHQRGGHGMSIRGSNFPRNQRWWAESGEQPIAKASMRRHVMRSKQFSYER